MRCGIDAARQPGHDHKTCVAEIARHAFGEFHAGRRSIARADNRNEWPLKNFKLAAHCDDRRRVVDHFQSLGIVRLAQYEKFDARRARCL